MTQQTTKPIRIRIIDGTSVLTAALEGSASAADFASMLPLSMTLEDYAATEKIAYLPRKLTTAGAPAGVDPAVADIAYATGLIRLGRLDGGVPSLQRNGPVTVRIERIEN